MDLDPIDYNKLEIDKIYVLKTSIGSIRIYIDDLLPTNNGMYVSYYHVNPLGNKQPEKHRIYLSGNTDSPKFYRIAPTITSTTTTTIDPKHGMEVLHQTSGKCWHDAILVLLWFGSGIGPSVQQRLSEPNVNKEFTKWIYDDRVVKQLTNIFPDIGEEYPYFASVMIEYFQVLQNRFTLWKSVESQNFRKPRNERARRMSCNLSEKGSIAGKIISEILYHNSSSTDYIKKVKEHNIKGGYASGKFTNVLYLLMQFFLRGNIVLLAYHPDESDAYGNILKEMNTPVLIHNPYFRSIGRLRTPDHFQTIFDQIGPNFNLSMNIALLHMDQSSHAISLITASDGSEYLYDNNNYLLESINWSRFFKGINQRTSVLGYLENKNLKKIVIKKKKEITLDLPVNRVILFLLDIQEGLLHILTENSMNTYQNLNFMNDRPNNPAEWRSWGSKKLLEFMGDDLNFYVNTDIISLFYDPVQYAQANTSEYKFNILNQNNINAYYVGKKYLQIPPVPNPFTFAEQHPNVNTALLQAAYENTIISNTILKDALLEGQYDIAQSLIPLLARENIYRNIFELMESDKIADNDKIKPIEFILDNISSDRSLNLDKLLEKAIQLNNLALQEYFLSLIKSKKKQITNEEMKGGKRKSRKQKARARKTRKNRES